MGGTGHGLDVCTRSHSRSRFRVWMGEEMISIGKPMRHGGWSCAPGVVRYAACGHFGQQIVVAVG